MVETAEILRERDTEAPPAPPAGAPPAPPRPAPSPLDQVAQEALGNVSRTQGSYADALRTRAETFKPQVAGVVNAGNEFGREAAASVVKPPALPPPPSRSLRAYLAPTEGQAPEQTINSLIGALGMFATGATALHKGNAKTALSALTGALKGWQEGDTERADRAYKDWQAQTTTLLNAWEMQRTAWEDWFKASKLSLEQRTKGLELAMMQSGFEIDPMKVEAEGAKYLMERIDQQQKNADTLALRRDDLERQRVAQQHTDDYRNAHLQIERDKLAQKEREHAQQIKAQEAAYTPDVLAKLGQDYALTNKMPALGHLGKDSPVRGQIVAAAIKWARDRGINPTDLPAIAAEVDAAKKGLTDITKRSGVAEVAVGTFERHMAQLVELGKKVDRSGMPVLNRFLLKAKGQYQGDADVAAFESMAFEAAQEFAKVSVGTAQGDSGSREEARRAINTALTQEQLERVSTELRQAARSRMAQYAETRKRYSDIVDTAGGRVVGSKPKESASPKSADGWSIKRLD